MLLQDVILTCKEIMIIQQQLHFEDLKNPSEVGEKAGERAASRLNSKKIKSSNVDVYLSLE